MKISALIISSALLVGCGQQYRYPCQNPDNWDKLECKPPVCEVNQNCPHHIFKGDEDIRDQLPDPDQPASVAKPSPQSTPSATKGECK